MQGDRSQPEWLTILVTPASPASLANNYPLLFSMQQKFGGRTGFGWKSLYRE